MCLPSEALLQHLPPYLGFSYLGQAAAAGALSAGGCSPEELPHIRGEGQKPGGPHAQRVVAKRSYPTSEVRGGSREKLPHTPTPEARGGNWEEQPHVQGAVDAWTEEGLEELSHLEGQEGRR